LLLSEQYLVPGGRTVNRKNEVIKDKAPEERPVHSSCKHLANQIFKFFRWTIINFDKT